MSNDLSIKFSHHYGKLRAAEPEMRARLLDVIPIELRTLSPEFLEYDTDNVFELPRTGKYLMLLLEGSRGLFTTLRAAWPPHKENYYRKLIGSTFRIEITK